MTTFDLVDVRAFTASLDARMNQCDNGEGLECANLDGTLRHYAVLCWEFCEQVRKWGGAIFYGKAGFDPEVEKLWLDEGMTLYRRASNVWESGQEMQGQCFVLDNGAALGSALWRLERLLVTWVRPKPAVAPLARLGIAMTQPAREEAQKRIDALPPLPSEWQPSDPRQHFMFRKLPKLRNP